MLNFITLWSWKYCSCRCFGTTTKMIKCEKVLHLNFQKFASYPGLVSERYHFIKVTNSQRRWNMNYSELKQTKINNRLFVNMLYSLDVGTITKIEAVVWKIYRASSKMYIICLLNVSLICIITQCFVLPNYVTRF